jgi:hypothetical protein
MTATNRIPPFEAIRTVLEYNNEEAEHYEDMQRNGEDCSDHIFLALRQISDWLAACSEI